MESGGGWGRRVEERVAGGGRTMFPRCIPPEAGIRYIPEDPVSRQIMVTGVLCFIK